MQPTAEEGIRPVSAWKSPWVIAWVALVVVVLGVNLLMVYLAIATNPGLVVEGYYEHGRQYERTLVSKPARDPGWAMRSDIPREIKAGERAVIRFFLVDRAGQPVVPDGVDLYAYRPSDAAQDFNLAMTEEGRGRYRAEVAFPLMGVWDTLVVVRSGGEEYSLAQRIDVRRP